MSYTIILTLHLFCAIIFIGFVFADIFVLPVMKKVLDQESLEKVNLFIGNRARKIFPISLLILVLSGGFMLSKFVNSTLGAFNTPLQVLLMIKVFLAFFIVCGVIYSLSMKLLKKQPHPIMKNFHKFVLVNGFLIVILAKFMFAV